MLVFWEHQPHLWWWYSLVSKLLIGLRHGSGHLSVVQQWVPGVLTSGDWSGDHYNGPPPPIMEITGWRPGKWFGHQRWTTWTFIHRWYKLSRESGAGRQRGYYVHNYADGDCEYALILIFIIFIPAGNAASQYKWHTLFVIHFYPPTNPHRCTFFGWDNEQEVWIELRYK